ncbi:MAG: beta-lactamase family protein [Alphaproteobacteria bacterium]|nr:beta-lactamase family protein [Alphaproteobacteria bacterium]MCB9797451.1 beta-lactamase family protein [Alphaproteobacteria bacterium]
MLTLLLLACAARQAPPESDAPAVPVEEAIADAARPVERASMALLIGHRQGDEVQLYAFGQLSAEDPQPPDGDTVFEIGSITKGLTGLLLADATLRGEVALDDPVAAHLPGDWTLPEGESGPVRLVHLATHTSGLPRMPPRFKPADPLDPYADFDAARLQATLAEVELEAEPGETYAYSNLGVGLLGFALAGDGAAYSAALEERVLAPLGLEDTSAAPSDALLARLAPGHDSMRRRRPSWHLDALAGAGQVRSTANDLLSLAASSWLPDPLDEATALALTVHHHAEADPFDLGLAWHRAPEGQDFWWHNGGTGGYRSFLAFNPEQECAVVVLATTMSPLVDKLGLDTWALLCQP